MGSNLGDRETHLRLAVQALRERLGPLTVASLYSNRPLRRDGTVVPQGPVFLNTALISPRPAGLDPRALLAWTQHLERVAGRRPTEVDAPRPLDIDLLVFGERTIDTVDLTVPHPRLHQRRFVLAPLAEIAPNLPVPPLGTSIEHLLEQLPSGEPVRRRHWTKPP